VGRTIYLKIKSDKLETRMLIRTKEKEEEGEARSFLSACS
jgi:hypothetical protein